MAEYDNPAKRLHMLLTAYRAQASAGQTIRLTWADVLDCDPAEVGTRLADAAPLISALTRDVAATGDELQMGAVSHFGPKWAAPLLLPSHNPDQTPSPGPSLVDADALVTLGGVASFLTASGMYVVVPDDDGLAKARSQVSDAISLLLAAEDLPLQVRRDLVTRLHEVLWALDRISLTGAEPVTAAMERFAGTVVVNGKITSSSGTIKKVMAAVGVAWAVFMTGPRIENALESWSHLAGISAGNPDPPTVDPTPSPN